MKKTILSLVTVAAFAMSSLTSHAQSSPKILTVDLAKIFDSHWKTKEQMAKLQADEQKAQDELAQISKDGNALVEQYKELDEQSKNPTATAEAKAKAQADAQKILEQIQQKHNERDAFIQNTRNTLGQRSSTFKNLLVEEISKAAVEIAKRHGATFLIDKSGPTMAGVSAILYADPSLDITDEVMAEVNKDRPAATPTADTTPAASTASPASDSAPKITVPGISPSK